jgi:hypothetical protein
MQVPHAMPGHGRNTPRRSAWACRRFECRPPHAESRFWCLVSTPALAGHNAAGRAFLSWDRAGADTVLAAVPLAPFALYLHLRDAPDVRALAARIVWTTGTSAPPCFFLQSSDEPELSTPPDSLLGWAVHEPPGAGFQGDTSFAWSAM